MSLASNLLATRQSMLRDRAKMLAKVRHFFYERQIMEVDVPILSQKPPIDVHIDVIEATILENRRGYFHTSPEYAMKRLLSEGLHNIYFLGHVFRKNEKGSFHNPEFTMIEWYRNEFSLQEMIKETLSLLFLFIPKQAIKIQKYHDLFLKKFDIDYLKATAKDFYHLCQEKNFSLPSSAKEWDLDIYLDFLMSHIENELGKDHLFILTDFPPSKAALAKIEGQVAKRFEIYFQGLEIANGYLELTDYKEQKKRFYDANIKRRAAGKKTYPYDERLINALKTGIGNVSGVSVGFDRLLMLRHQKTSIDEVVPFSWNEA